MGKTQDAIEFCIENDVTLVVRNNQMVRNATSGTAIQAMTYDQLLGNRGHYPTQVMIDDIDAFTEHVLRRYTHNVHLRGLTVTPEKLILKGRNNDSN